jgi:hypothetical protein
MFFCHSYRRKSPRLTGKKRLNYAEQQNSLDNLQVLINAINDDARSQKTPQRKRLKSDETITEKDDDEPEDNQNSKGFNRKLNYDYDSKSVD